ncbi:MAG: hypothetical protein HY534_08280 [Chloroflexi bacterium]|nr:hypothetical protein [Chloroflexota bacterium]
MHVQLRRDRAVDLIQKLAELHGAMATLTRIKDAVRELGQSFPVPGAEAQSRI